MSLAGWISHRWFQAGLAPALLPLLPVNLLFVLLSSIRRLAYRTGWLRSVRLAVPVVVVGNITVGGAGKTPLVQWLARELAARGMKPGIVSRGYGARARVPQRVLPDTPAAEVGDEPVLLARSTGVPVWVGRDRAAAGAALLQAHPEVNVILCDDGLQHYRLARDLEVAVLDGRGIGNGWRLPMGPLREPVSRLESVAALVFNGGDAGKLDGLRDVPRFELQLEPGMFYRLDAPGIRCQAEQLRDKPLVAMAGIGDPERFFRTLEALGLVFERRPYPDHRAYTAADLLCSPETVLLMTEKDAVKCAGLAKGEAWVLPVEADITPALADILLEKINGREVA